MTTIETFESRFDFAKFMVRVSDYNCQVGNITYCSVKGYNIMVVGNYIAGPNGYTTAPSTQAEAIEYLKNL